jgi:AbiV family abortive infection protein
LKSTTLSKQVHNDTLSQMPYITNIIEKKKVVGLEIDIGLRNDMVRFIQQRIIHNLEAIKRFLKFNEENYDDICVGLYTYALEEYGKILFLNRCPTLPNNKIKVRYTQDNHGFLNHDHKFNLAKSALPDSYMVLREGDYNSEDYDGNDYVVDTPADFEARMSVFYADFNKDDNYNSILKPLEVSRDKLVKNIDKFLEFIMAQKYP